MNVAQDGYEISIILYWLAFETILKEMPASIVPLIESIRIRDPYALDDPRQRDVLLAEKEMNMIAHQAIGIQNEWAFPLHARKYLQVKGKISVVFENSLLVDPSCKHVVNAARAFLPRSPRHVRLLMAILLL